MKTQILTKYIEEAIATQVFPGGGFFVEYNKKPVLDTTLGSLGYDNRAVTSDTSYDIASLTKMMTVTAALQLIEARGITLDTQIREFLPEYSLDTTILQLMTHTSGIKKSLRPWYFQDRTHIERELFATSQEGDKNTVWYSCNNTVLLGKVIEGITGQSLAHTMEAYVWQPLGMRETGYQPRTPLVAPTEVCGVRGEVCGIVHDEKAYTFGYPVGNAGVFSTLGDMKIFLEWWIEKSAAGLWQRAMSNNTPTADFPQGLGWLCDRIGVRSVVTYPGLVAHAGFTGCQLLWWPNHMLKMVVLTNRTFPKREEEKFTRFIEGLIQLTLENH